MAPHFHLRCLGEPSLSDGSGLPIRFRVRKHLALVLYLMLERRRKASRERLRRLLWPSGKASQSLSQALNEIRASLGDEALDVGTHAVGLAADVLVQVDVHELRHASAPRLLEALVGHHLPDALLEGMEFGDAEEWNDWLWATRRELTAGVVGRAVEEFGRYLRQPNVDAAGAAMAWLLSHSKISEAASALSKRLAHAVDLQSLRLIRRESSIDDESLQAGADEIASRGDRWWLIEPGMLRAADHVVATAGVSRLVTAHDDGMPNELALLNGLEKLLISRGWQSFWLSCGSAPSDLTSTLADRVLSLSGVAGADPVAVDHLRSLVAARGNHPVAQLAELALIEAIDAATDERPLLLLLASDIWHALQEQMPALARRLASHPRTRVMLAGCRNEGLNVRPVEAAPLRLSRATLIDLLRRLHGDGVTAARNIILAAESARGLLPLAEAVLLDLEANPGICAVNDHRLIYGRGNATSSLLDSNSFAQQVTRSAHGRQMLVARETQQVSWPGTLNVDQVAGALMADDHEAALESGWTLAQHAEVDVRRSGLAALLLTRLRTKEITAAAADEFLRVSLSQLEAVPSKSILAAEAYALAILVARSQDKEAYARLTQALLSYEPEPPQGAGEFMRMLGCCIAAQAFRDHSRSEQFLAQARRAQLESSAPWSWRWTLLHAICHQHNLNGRYVRGRSAAMAAWRLASLAGNRRLADRSLFMLALASHRLGKLDEAWSAWNSVSRQLWREQASPTLAYHYGETAFAMGATKQAEESVEILLSETWPLAGSLRNTPAMFAADLLLSAGRTAEGRRAIPAISDPNVSVETLPSGIEGVHIRVLANAMNAADLTELSQGILRSRSNSLDLLDRSIVLANACRGEKSCTTSWSDLQSSLAALPEYTARGVTGRI